MSKGFSDNEVNNDTEIKDVKKENKFLPSFIRDKKITYTLPSKKQQNILASIVLGLNGILLLIVILYLNNQKFHEFILNIGR